MSETLNRNQTLPADFESIATVPVTGTSLGDKLVPPFGLEFITNGSTLSFTLFALIDSNVSESDLSFRTRKKGSKKEFIKYFITYDFPEETATNLTLWKITGSIENCGITKDTTVTAFVKDIDPELSRGTETTVQETV